MHNFAYLKIAMHRALQNLIEQEGWTQTDLARELGITQGYLSRFLRGKNRPRKELRERITRLTSHIASSSDEDFTERVRRAASASAQFKNLVEAALGLVEVTNKKE